MQTTEQRPKPATKDDLGPVPDEVFSKLGLGPSDVNQAEVRRLRAEATRRLRALVLHPFPTAMRQPQRLASQAKRDAQSLERAYSESRTLLQEAQEELRTFLAVLLEASVVVHHQRVGDKPFSSLTRSGVHAQLPSENSWKCDYGLLGEALLFQHTRLTERPHGTLGAQLEHLRRACENDAAKTVETFFDYLDDMACRGLVGHVKRERTQRGESCRFTFPHNAFVLSLDAASEKRLRQSRSLRNPGWYLTRHGVGLLPLSGSATRLRGIHVHHLCDSTEEPAVHPRWWYSKRRGEASNGYHKRAIRYLSEDTCIDSLGRVDTPVPVPRRLTKVLRACPGWLGQSLTLIYGARDWGKAFHRTVGDEAWEIDQPAKSIAPAASKALVRYLDGPELYPKLPSQSATEVASDWQAVTRWRRTFDEKGDNGYSPEGSPQFFGPKGLLASLGLMWLYGGTAGKAAAVLIVLDPALCLGPYCLGGFELDELEAKERRRYERLIGQMQEARNRETPRIS